MSHQGGKVRFGESCREGNADTHQLGEGDLQSPSPELIGELTGTGGLGKIGLHDGQELHIVGGHPQPGDQAARPTRASRR